MSQAALAEWLYWGVHRGGCWHLTHTSSLTHLTCQYHKLACAGVKCTIKQAQSLGQSGFRCATCHSEHDKITCMPSQIPLPGCFPGDQMRLGMKVGDLLGHWRKHAGWESRPRYTSLRRGTRGCKCVGGKRAADKKDFSFSRAFQKTGRQLNK